MAEYLRKPYKFNAKGVSLRYPPDAMPEGLYPKLINVQPRTLGGLQPRAGTTPYNGLDYQTAIHSMRRLNDATDASAALLIGAGTSLYDQTSITAIDTGYSGTPLSLVPVQPRSSPKPWMVVADGQRMRKVNTGRTDYKVGIAPPIVPPVVQLGIPVFRYVSAFAAPGDWTNAGTAGAVSAFTRFNTTIAAILYDNLASVNTGWCSISPTAIDSNFQAGADILIGGVDIPKIHEVFEPITSTTIEGILYDSGSTGPCSIVLAEQSTGLRLNAMVRLGSEYVRVTSVSGGPSQQVSFRCATTGTHIAGEAVTGVASFRVFTNSTHAAGAALAGTAIQSTITAGTGTLSATVAVDLANINGFPTSQQDYVHLSLRIATPANLIEGRLVLDIDPSINDFQHNALYITFRGSDIQANVTGTETTLETGQTAIERQTIDRTAFDLLDSETRISIARATGLSGLDFLKALNAGQITRDGTAISAPSTVIPGHVPPKGQIRTPDTVISHQGQITQQQVEKIQSVTSPDNFPVSLQGAPGTAQWSELLFKVSDFTRIGSDPSVSLRDVKAIRLQFETSDSTAVIVDSLWLGGTFGADNGATAPYFYAQRYRSRTTGAISQPSPMNRSGVVSQRDQVLVFPAISADSQVELIDIFRLGGTLPSWRYVGSTANNGDTFIDTQSDSDIQLNEELSFAVFEPFPVSDLPRTGQCNVCGTSVIWVSGDTFNTRWAAGSEIIIGGIPYSLYAPPSSSTRLQIPANGGVQNDVEFFIADATIPATPMPAVWGPDPLTGVLFACGDGTGNLYWTNPADPDSASDANVYPVTSPSEPLQNGFIWNAQAFVWSTERLYRIIAANSGPGVQFIAQEVPSSHGLFGRYAFAVGPLVWWVSRHGVMEYDGSAARPITDDSLYPLFPHDGQPGSTVQDYAPFDMANPAGLRLFYTQDSLYLTDGTDVECNCCGGEPTFDLVVQLEMMESGISSFLGPTTYSRSQLPIDTADYDGTGHYYFSIVGLNTNASIAYTVLLVDAAGATKASIEIPANTTADKLFNLLPLAVEFTPNSGLDNYYVRTPSTAIDGQLIVRTVRVLISQTGATKTRLQFPLATTNTVNGTQTTAPYHVVFGSTTFTQNASSDDPVNHGIFLKELGAWADLAGGNPWSFETIARSTGSFSGQDTQVALFNRNTGLQVTGVENLHTAVGPLTGIALVSTEFSNTAVNFTDNAEFETKARSTTTSPFSYSSEVYRCCLYVRLENLNKASIYYRVAKNATTGNAVLNGPVSQINIPVNPAPVAYFEVSGNQNSAGDNVVMLGDCGVVQAPVFADSTAVAGTTLNFMGLSKTRLRSGPAAALTTNNIFGIRSTGTSGTTRHAMAFVIVKKEL